MPDTDTEAADTQTAEPIPASAARVTYALTQLWDANGAPLTTDEICAFLCEAHISLRSRVEVADALWLARKLGFSDGGDGFWAPGPRAWAEAGAIREIAFIQKCDVCKSLFTPADAQQARCSDECREFAIKHRCGNLAKLWKQAKAAQARERARAAPCPSGKVKYPNKKAAMKGGRGVMHLFYSGMQTWISVYECDRCFCWHLTSRESGKSPSHPVKTPGPPVLRERQT